MTRIRWAVPTCVLALVIAMAGCASRSPGSPAGPPPTPSVTGSPGSPGSPGPPTASTAPGPPAPVPLPTSGVWRTLPESPLAAGSYQGVWTGTELLVHSPDYRADRGSLDAAYNPATGRWRRVPSSGLPVRLSEAGTQIVWTGTEVLTFGIMNAAYNPATNAWRPLAAPPLGGPSIVAWTGSRVLIWGGGCCDDASAAGAAYDPAGNKWRMLPPAPLSGRHTDGVWTGTELIVVGGQAHSESFFADAAAYNPARGTWRMLPPLPAPRFDASVTWTGTEVLVVGGQAGLGSVPYADGFAYNPATNRWRHLPSMGIPRVRHIAVWTGHHLIVWGGQTRRTTAGPYAPPSHGTVYDPTTNRWYPLPAAPVRGRVDAIAAWTGSALIVWGGNATSEPYQQFTDGASYRPAR